MTSNAVDDSPKRRAILVAATHVFGRDGYTRASVDTIAEVAAVSKRTVYKYFEDKEQLFLVAALEGATTVSAEVRRLADYHLHKIVDLRTDLTAFALDRIEAVLGAKDHAALSRTMRAEVTHIPNETLQQWIALGPQASEHDIAAHFARMKKDGLLAFENGTRAVSHFSLLTFTAVSQRTFDGARTMPAKEVRQLVTDGVSAFLTLHEARQQRA